MEKVEKDEYGNEIDAETGEAICRFCGYLDSEHTALVKGVRICPDQEPIEEPMYC